MTLYLYLVVLFFNLVIAFRQKSSKLLTMVTLLAILLLICGAGPNYVGQNDYINYKIRYDNIQNVGLFDNIQVGYTLLMKAGNAFGLDFFWFRVLITAICLLLIYKKVIRKYGFSSNYVLAVYMIYPMIIDSEHFRNFIAMTLFLLAVKYLEDSSLSGNIKFVMMVLLAASVHTAFIFYLPFVFVHSEDKNKLVKWIAIATGILTVVAILNDNNVPFVRLIIDVLDDQKAISYLSRRTNLGYLVPVILHSMSIVLLAWSRSIVSRKDSRATDLSLQCKATENLNTELDFVSLVFWLNIAGIMFFPLFIMSLTFYRLSRNLLILNFTVYSIISSKLRAGSVYKFVFNFVVLLSTVVWLIADLIVTTAPERVLIPFFTRNSFLN